jgi:Lon protease-like protein
MSATLELLRRHVGVWEGEYTHIAAADRRVLETQRFRIRVEVFDTGTTVYRQTSHYWWPDGREDELVYSGSLRAADDHVVFDDGRIRGECWAIEPDTLYLFFAYISAPAARIAEMIQLSPDGLQRARTWHWFNNHELQRITLVREQHVSLDPADWPAVHGPQSS